MSRSAADATRFTATGPYANSKSAYKLPDSMKTSEKQSTISSQLSASSSKQAPSSSSSSSSSAPPGETPRQKVERLRAQARAARLAQSTSTFDRVIERSRRVANSAHKVMIYTLIAASGVCGAVTLYSAGSITVWNRRQRDLWLDRQLQDLQAAREAYTNGIATPEQLEILRNEKIGEIERQKRKEADEQKLWNRTKRYLFDGLKKEEEGDSSMTTIATNNNIINNSSNNTPAEGSSSSSSFGILEAVNAKKAESQISLTQMQTQTQPGSLDVLASNAETTAKQSVKSWTSWIWGR